MSAHLLVVDDEPDMEALFRQQFRRDLKSGRVALAFATSAQRALGMIEGAGGRDIALLHAHLGHYDQAVEAIEHFLPRAGNDRDSTSCRPKP